MDKSSSKGQALSTALAVARRRGRLRECGDLKGLMEAAAPFMRFEPQPEIFRTWVHQPGACYVLAVVPSGPFLSPGEWHVGPVTVDGRDGIAVVLVVDDATVRAIERPLLRQVRRGAPCARRRVSGQSLR